MSSAVAAAGVFTLAILAPFEMTSPLVRLPWQSLSNLEAALLLSIAGWGAALVWSRRGPRLGAATPLAPMWAALVAAMALAAATAPVERANAWHMTGRVAAAAIVYFLTVEGVTTRARLQLALALCAATGILVAALAILEYLQVDPILHALRAFRPSVTAVGDQLRAGGPLQYPTIASMYLEVVFAFGLGLMMAALDRSDWVGAGIWFAALGAIAQAITLTFTRAGLITMATSLVLVGVWRTAQRGWDRGGALVAALALAIGIMVFGARSSESVWLRMTSEGQDSWYRARVEAPSELRFGVDRTVDVRVTVTNSGRATWDSDAAAPIYLSYHWLDPAERVVAYEGARAGFTAPVAPGASAAVDVPVRAPRWPGEYRLEWDLVQEDRLWFSTEQGAPEPTITRAIVAGEPLGGPPRTTERPRRAVRPGRMVLWRTAVRMIAAHPLLGVGPDNFRLLYGSYAGLERADRRTHSNNMYLEVLVSGGLVAGAAFAYFAAAVWQLIHKGSDPDFGEAASNWGQTPYDFHMGIAAAMLAIALHGLVDSFLSFAPTYILFSLTLGFAAAAAGGLDRPAHAHRV